MTAPVEETVETHPPATGDRIRLRPRGVRARVKAGTPGARAGVRTLTPDEASRELPPAASVPGARMPEPGSRETEAAASTTGSDTDQAHPAGRADSAAATADGRAALPTAADADPVAAPNAADRVSSSEPTVASTAEALVRPTGEPASAEGHQAAEANAAAVDVSDELAGGRSRGGAAAARAEAAPSSVQATPAHSPAARVSSVAPGDADSPGAPVEPTPAAKFLRVLRTHFGTLAGTVILVVVFWRMGTGVFVDGLRRIDGGTLAAAVGIGVLTTVFSAWRWCAVTRALGLKLPLGPAVADYYRALFLNAALPGGVLGDVHRAVRHGQSSGDMGRGVRAVVIERTAGQLVLAAVGVTVLLVLPSPVLEETRHAAGVAALAALGALAIWAAVRMGRRPSVSGGGRGRRVRAALVEARGVLLQRDSGPAVLISSVAVLAGYVATFLLAADVAGSTAGPLRLLPLALLALIAMSLPLNVGGWGPREGVTAWSFGAAGLGASQGLTVAVVYGVLSFAAALPGALVLVGRWYGSLRARRQSPEGETGEGTGPSPQASEVTNERYAPKDSTKPASNSFPFVADARDGRPITPESV